MHTSVLLINCSGIERLGSLATPLHGAPTVTVTQLTTHDAVRDLKVPLAPGVKLVDALPCDDREFDGLIVMGGPFSVRTAASDEGEVRGGSIHTSTATRIVLLLPCCSQQLLLLAPPAAAEPPAASC